MSKQDERGFIILAVNTELVDYVECARLLAKSIKQWHPKEKICLVTDQPYQDDLFDYVKLLPHGDQAPNSTWKLNNDWQIFQASPFQHTIKIEADCLVTSPIDHWWTMFYQWSTVLKNDVAVSVGARNLQDQLSENRFYRKVFDENHLPDVYNAVTYWRCSQFAKDFFKLVKLIFQNWDDYKLLLKFPPDKPDTDLVYAMAAAITGTEKTTMPFVNFTSIVHMKKHIVPIKGSDWTRELVWELNDRGLRINTLQQFGIVHYHIKDWCKHVN